MRWLVLIGVVGSVACTRVNPSYGDGGAEGGGTDQGSDDPSGANEDASVSVGEDAEASADEVSSIETGQSEQGETGASRPCCLAHSDRGCDDDGVEECVCTSVPECCEIEWSDACVTKARDFCAAECLSTEEGHLDTSDTVASEGTSTSDASSSSTTETTEPATSDVEGTAGASTCCEIHGDPQCNDLDIEDCVCVQNELEACCSESWGELCVDAAMECGAGCA